MPSDTCAELGQQERIREPTEKSELWIVNVRLPLSLVSSEEERDDYDGTWIVKCSDSFVTDVLKTPKPGHIASTIDNVQILDVNGGIMIPSSVSFNVIIHSRRDCDDTTLSTKYKVMPFSYSSRQMLHFRPMRWPDRRVCVSKHLPSLPPMGKITLRFHYHCTGSWWTSLDSWEFGAKVPHRLVGIWSLFCLLLLLLVD